MININEYRKNHRQELAQKIAAGQYGAALNSLAKLVEAKDVTAEDLYQGAYAYFMLGDYERAAAFVNNTLSYEGGHVRAKILLARICIVEDRTESALEILNGLLGPGADLTVEQREEIRDLTEYYGRIRREDIVANYPAIAAFLGLANAPAVKEAEGLKIDNLAQTSSVAIDEVDKEIKAVLASPVSLSEKVTMLQRFAGGYYVAGELGAAEAMLTAALKLDGGSDDSLSGMALIAKAKGDGERALKFTAGMKRVDFILLTLLKA